MVDATKLRDWAQRINDAGKGIGNDGRPLHENTSTIIGLSALMLEALSAPEASGADAFAAAMKGCQYGEGQTANARHWFMAGYNARLNPAPPTSGPDSFVMVESAVRSLPSGYAFADAVEHATPADESGAEVRELGERVEWQDSPGNWTDATICGRRDGEHGKEYEIRLDDCPRTRLGWYSPKRLRTPTAEPRAAAQEDRHAEDWAAFLERAVQEVRAKHNQVFVRLWDYEAALIAKHLRRLTSVAVARPLEEWHEDMGDVVWWKFPIEEAAHIGSPLSSDWPGYHTHFTPHPEIPAEP